MLRNFKWGDKNEMKGKQIYHQCILKGPFCWTSKVLFSMHLEGIFGWRVKRIVFFSKYAQDTDYFWTKD